MIVDVLKSEEIRGSYLQCREYTRRHAKSFYFASQVLPEAKRNAAYAIYAFCRYADNIVDAGNTNNDNTRALRRLSALRDQLRYAYTHSPQMDPKLHAFRDTVMTYRIPQTYFLDLLRGVEMDLSKSTYRTFEELCEYCYCVASVVGLMMTRVFGSTHPDAERHAIDLGIAMQLTNILRDVGEDQRMGRCYLPESELEWFGYTREDLDAGVINHAFRELMSFQVRRARDYYALGEAGVSLLTNDGSRFCVRLMSGTYSGILDEIIANDFDVFTRRAYVTFPRKLGLGLRAALLFCVRPQANISRSIESSAPAYPGHEHGALPPRLLNNLEH